MTRLQAPKKQLPSVKHMFFTAGIICLIVLLLVNEAYNGSIYRFLTRPPVIAQLELPNSENLVVHGVLRNGLDSMRFRGRTINGGYKFGLSLVISCNNRQTGRTSDWTWLKQFEVEDKYGSLVEGTTAQIIHLTENGREVRQSLDLIDSESCYETYYVIHFPMVETDKPCEFLAIGSDDKVWARVESPLPPLKPAEGFYDHSHNLIARNGPWKVELSRATTVWHADHKGLGHDRINAPEIQFEYEGNLLQKDDVLQLDGEFSDALGNPVDMYAGLNQQPLWKYSLKVARCDYPTNKQAKELLPLGRVSDLSVSTELKISEEQIKAKSLLYLPVGVHAKVVQFNQVGESPRSSRLGRGFHRLQLRSRSGNTTSNGTTEERSITAVYSLNITREVLKLDLKKQPNPPAKLKIDAKLPLVMLELEEPTQEGLMNLFAFDQLNRALRVNTVPNEMPNLPMFLIEAEDDTRQIDLFYSVEPIIPIEFYMIPPTKNFALPESGFTWFRMTGTQDGWKVDQQHSTEK